MAWEYGWIYDILRCGWDECAVLLSNLGRWAFWEVALEHADPGCEADIMEKMAVEPFKCLTSSHLGDAALQSLRLRRGQPEDLLGADWRASCATAYAETPRRLPGNWTMNDDFFY